MTRTVSLTLHTCLSQLDGHPYIDSVYVNDDNDRGCLDVHVTLNTNADVTRYGLRDDDRVEMLDAVAGIARVTRGKRTWTLWASRAECTDEDADASRSRVTQRVPVTDGWTILNAPHVTVDVAARFDARHYADLRDDVLEPRAV